MHSSRPIAALAVLIFLLIGAGDVFGLRACPHHEAGGGHGHAPANEPALPGHEHGSEADPVPQAEHEPCSCAGYCPTGATLSPPAEGVVSVLPTAATSDAVSRRPVERPYHRVAPHVLPFAQAPPAGH